MALISNNSFSADYMGDTRKSPRSSVAGWWMRPVRAARGLLSPIDGWSLCFHHIEYPPPPPTVLLSPLKSDSFQGDTRNRKEARGGNAEEGNSLCTSSKHSPHNQAASRETKGRGADFISSEMWYRAESVLSNRWSSHKGQSKTDSKIIK